MLYNQTQIQGNSMPLLMGFTEQTKIEFGDMPSMSYYDPISQIRPIECARQVGTRSLRVRVQGGKEVRKNEIDDTKTVK